MTEGDGAPAPGPEQARPSLKQRLSTLFEEYGRIAVITYFALSILAIIGCSIAVGLGFKPASSTGVLGVIFAGWALAKITLPFRIVITLGLTPVIAIVTGRRRAATAAASADEPVAPDAEAP